MKTAGRRTPNRWATVARNRAPGTGGQNRSCSMQWAEKQEKVPASAEVFFLDFSFYRTYQKDWTQFIHRGGRVESATLSDLHIQLGPSGDTAVASYSLHVRTRNAKGKVSDEDNQESDVFFKRGGVWKIVFLHYSPAPKKKAQ
jgi:hypothetical protein